MTVRDRASCIINHGPDLSWSYSENPTVVIWSSHTRQNIFGFKIKKTHGNQLKVKLWHRKILSLVLLSVLFTFRLSSLCLDPLWAPISSLLYILFPVLKQNNLKFYMDWNELIMMFYFSLSIVFQAFYLHLEMKTLFPDKGFSNTVSEKLCGEAEKPS